MEPTLWSDKSSLPDTTKQLDNQTCKARTRVTMQRLLHGLGTQVLGHVQVASPQAPFFPKVPICSPPPPPFKVKVKGFYTHKTFSPVVDRDSVELEAKGQASAQSTTGTVTCGANKRKKKLKTLIVAHFEKFENFENFENFEF